MKKLYFLLLICSITTSSAITSPESINRTLKSYFGQPIDKWDAAHKKNFIRFVSGSFGLFLASKCGDLRYTADKETCGKHASELLMRSIFGTPFDFEVKINSVEFPVKENERADLSNYLNSAI